jgi:hypothetical protein
LTIKEYPLRIFIEKLIEQIVSISIIKKPKTPRNIVDSSIIYTYLIFHQEKCVSFVMSNINSKTKRKYGVNSAVNIYASINTEIASRCFININNNWFAKIKIHDWSILTNLLLYFFQAKNIKKVYSTWSFFIFC